MKLESKTIRVAQNIQTIFEKMQNVATFEQLMPNNLQKFSVLSEDSFVFALRGMPEIYLEKKKTTPYTELVYGAIEGKIPFQLTLFLTPITDKQTDVQFSFEGNFNPMMALMVKAPVSKLIETMAEKVSQFVF